METVVHISLFNVAPTDVLDDPNAMSAVFEKCIGLRSHDPRACEVEIGDPSAAIVVIPF